MIPRESITICWAKVPEGRFDHLEPSLEADVHLLNLVLHLLDLSPSPTLFVADLGQDAKGEVGRLLVWDANADNALA